MTSTVRADIGVAHAESRVSVEISGPANVRLLRGDDMVCAQFGLPYLFIGGCFTSGVVTLRVPELDRWWLLVDALPQQRGPVWVSPVRISRPRRPANRWWSTLRGDRLQ